MALKGWPEVTGPPQKLFRELLERNKLIFEAVREGDFDHQWCPLKLSDGNDTLEIFVSCDALKVNGVRVNVDAFTQQEIADEIGGLLLTPKIVDEIFRARPSSQRLRPQTMPITSSTRGMILHSQRVQAEGERVNAEIPPPLANVGKDWVISKKLFTPGARKINAAVNYGWLGTGRDRSVTGLPIIQSEGTRHNIGAETSGHTDYSQVARFVRRTALLNGEIVDLADVYMGEEDGTALVSHTGALPSARLPGVVKGFPATSLPTTTPTKTSNRTLVATSVIGASVGAVAAGVGGALIGAVVGGVVGALVKRKT